MPTSDRQIIKEVTFLSCCSLRHKNILFNNTNTREIKTDLGNGSINLIPPLFRQTKYIQFTSTTHNILVLTRKYQPFKPQYPHTTSPNWSPYISLENELREFDKRSRHFFLGDHFINSHNLSVDSVWILLGENWSWSLVALKGLRELPPRRLREELYHNSR